MEWVAALTKTITYIEDNLHRNITVEDVADHIYMSSMYLQKGFQIFTGFTIGEYIRNRRLTLAADDILNTDRKIIDIAFEYGYDTPESFTKAFTRFHGVSPLQMRKNKLESNTFLPMKISINIQGGNKTMDYVISSMFPFKLIGFERIINIETQYEEVPKFWDEIQEKFIDPVYASHKPANPIEQAVMDNFIGEYGACLCSGSADGTFRYIIAGRYTGGEVPEGMVLIDVPGHQWAKFRCTGALPEAIQNVDAKVFTEWLPNNPDYEIADNISIEWYSCDGENTSSDYQSAVWVPVVKK